MGSRPLILLDTQALIWLDRGIARLGPATRRMIDEALKDDRLAVSAISFWEAAMLAAKGRIVLPDAAVWRRRLIAHGVLEIALDGDIAIRSVGLQQLHGDPADRMILATALVRDASLVTTERKLLEWPGPATVHDAAA